MKKQAKATASKKATGSTKSKTKSSGSSKGGKRASSLATSQTAQGPKKLLMKLAEDPQIKRAMDTIDHGANAAKVENFRDTVKTLMSMSRSFIGSKRALKLAAYAEVMILAYRLGLLLKTNILDRPEVKAYLEENFQGIKNNPAYKVARSFISSAIGSDASESEEGEDGEHLTRQQRRHKQEREANLAAMKNQGNSGPNRSEKRHAKGKATDEESEAHSEFIPSHKVNQGKAPSKNASKH